MASETPKSPVPPAITGEIGQFDASKLKHAETQEKNPLPTKEGQYFCHLKKFRCIQGFSYILPHFIAIVIRIKIGAFWILV